MSVLEIARQAYEDMEAYERAIGEQLDKKPRTAKQQVEQQHAISNLLDQIHAESATVATRVLSDEDGAFQEELAGMKGQNAFGAFYAALKDTKDYHAKHPGSAEAQPPTAAAALDHITAVKVEFSGEEVFGKYVDLVAMHDRASNLRACFPTPQDYAAYLGSFAAALADVPLTAKQSGAYAAYVRDLHAYLASFFQRTQPLVDVRRLLAHECDVPFQAAWAAGTVPGWAGATHGSGGSASQSSAVPKPVDLSNCHSADAVAALGLGRVGEGLAALGLKAGGSLGERSQRLFMTKNVPRDQWPKKAFAAKAAAAKVGGGNGSEASKEASKFYAVAQDEARVGWLGAQLEEAVAATLKHLERKHAISLEERQADMDEEEEAAGDADGGGGGAEAHSDDDDGAVDDAPLYNPLNLPLGWDGKPIPYWLFKLHGLGVEFKCEVCGNASYFGRRAFDKHFQEWRHAYGMRCLGIPNTKHFHDITGIEDAVALHAKLQEGLDVEGFDPAVAEEFEDSDGHVLNRKTYEDLARQGLL